MLCANIIYTLYRLVPTGLFYNSADTAFTFCTAQADWNFHISADVIFTFYTAQAAETLTCLSPLGEVAMRSIDGEGNSLFSSSAETAFTFCTAQAAGALASPLWDRCIPQGLSQRATLFFILRGYYFYVLHRSGRGGPYFCRLWQK